jgi:hypothetical protein
MLGRYRSEVSKRVDVLVAALFHEMKIEDLVDLDLSYTPPLSSPLTVPILLLSAIGYKPRAVRITSNIRCRFRSFPRFDRFLFSVDD